MMIIQDALPHRPPMVLITEVLSTDENGGFCKASTTNSFIIVDGQLRTSIFIELMAQAHGYATAAIASHAPKNALLVGVNNFKIQSIHVLNFKGSYLYIKTTLIKRIDPFSVVKGEIIDEKDNILAVGELKLYAN